eukprot:COSAG02_NODE_63308_length_263_cov_0.951220_1_plen_54_part_01
MSVDNGITTCECSCVDGFLGVHCEVAPAYIISGSTTDAFNGRYERLESMCNDKH